VNFRLAYRPPLDQIVLPPLRERPAGLRKPQTSLLCWKETLALEGSRRCMRYRTPGEPSLGDTKNM